MPKGLLLWCCMLWLGISQALAQPIVVDRDFPKQAISHPYLEYLEDPSGTLTINDVASAAYESQFKPLPGASAGFGLSRSHYWLRFSVDYREPAGNDLIAIQRNPLTEYLSFYQPDGRGGFTRSVTGGHRPFAERELQVREFVWHLKAHPGTVQTYYLEFHGPGALDVELGVTSEHAAWADTQTTHLIMGTYFGGTIALLIYNLFLYFSVRDRAYLYYIAYIASATCLFFGMNGLGFRYWWPQNTWWNVAYIVFGFSSLLGMVAFTRSFLQTATLSRNLDRTLKLMLFILVAGASGIFWMEPHEVMAAGNVATMVGSMTCLIAGVIALHRGYRPARYYVISWIAVLGGIITYTLKNLGILPYTLLTHYAAQLGSFTEMLLLSLALGDRINLLRSEKERIELESRQQLVDINQKLEQRVHERTLELSKSMRELEEKHTQLLEKEQQLIQAEKMSSLGGLVAGIAHEINNPANFTRLSSENLARDMKRTQQFLHELADPENDQDVLTELDERFSKMQSHLRLVDDGTQRITRIVSDLRSFSRLDEAEKKTAAPDQGLEATLHLVQAQYRDRIRFEMSAEAPEFIMECYPAQLNQVFMNLMVNGCQAILTRHEQSGEPAKEDGSCGTLSVHSGLGQFQGKTCWYARISDDGTGMSKELQKKIFEPFFTTKAVGEGTGLGLSVSYGIIRNHEGEIEVESAPGKGTSFTLWLPVATGTDRGETVIKEH